MAPEQDPVPSVRQDDPTGGEGDAEAHSASSGSQPALTPGADDADVEAHSAHIKWSPEPS